nr:MAG TPA: major capsid protein [Caudoviricetes sp.]
MATITKTTNLFPAEFIPQIFSKVAGHSTLAKLSKQEPIPFSETSQFVFTMDGEASIVGEGDAKPAGDAGFKPVTIAPIKFVYQHRLTDEFVNMSEEKQVPYLQAFTDGFAKKMARALDIAAMHGVNPATGSACEAIASKNFDMAEVGSVTVTAGSEDDTLDAAIQTIVASDGAITGIAMAPAFGSDLAKIKVNGVVQYPEFRFGGNPGTFASVPSDINNTVSFKTSKDLAIVGDFANAFKWGFAENIPMEVIEYGDPDGQGDLKKTNQIVLRAEAYIGWGILDNASFKKIVKAEA